MIHSMPEVLLPLRSHLAKEIGEYATFPVGMRVALVVDYRKYV